jgi:potassium/hydrogen antiporter
MVGIDVVTLVALVGMLVFAAHFFAWLFSHTKVPDALLLMLVGLVLGPVLGVLTPAYLGDSAELIVTVVLIVVLFQGGLNMPWSALRQAWRGAVVLSMASFAVMMVLVGSVLWLGLGFDARLALMIGAVVGGTSSAVVIPLLRQLSVDEEGRTILTLESALTDVLAIVLTLAFLEARAGGSFSLPAVGADVILSFAGAAALGVVAALLWARLLVTVRQMHNSLFMTPALVFIVFAAVENMGFNGLIAVLAFGVLLGNVAQLNHYLDRRHLFWRYLLQSSPLARRERLFFRELAFLLQTFFFVFIGLSLRLQSAGPLLLGLLLVGLMVVVRLAVVRAILPRQVSVPAATIAAIMVPKGLAAAALASLLVQRGLPQADFIQELVYALVLFSVVAASLLIFFVNRTSLRAVYAQLLAGFGRPAAVDRPGPDRMV